MGLQKFRADVMGQTQSDGSVPWFCNWMGGFTLALIRKCPTPFGKRVVYIQGEPDTFFSVPAACEIRVAGKRKKLNGYITTNEHGEYVFHTYQNEVNLLLGCKLIREALDTLPGD